ncbi:MAG: redoxin domain-containing protein [Candidatus Krumholzibacteriota bacterium]|nr:redoxin domain-containing protein [Candidatus Krumholzibacteriota bacterium]
MNKRIIYHFLIICNLLLLAGGASAGVIEPADPAPPFELPLLEGGKFVSADELFARHDFTFLIFWESGCEHCVEALRECEEFHRQFGGEDIGIIGINGDENNALAVKGLLEANRITFRQLRDRGRMVSAGYGVPRSVFAVFLVNGEGTVLASALDPPEDVYPVMESMLRGEDGAAGGAESSPGRFSRLGAGLAGTGVPAGFSLRGSIKLRFLSIDARGDTTVGPYGEKVHSRNDLLHRFELEISRRLGKNLRAGGLLRLSNEGLEVLRGGPQYLDSEWGSAFAEVEGGGFNLRLGYYPIYISPLTLMRWDWDDNPRTGGDAGCGCGEAVGVVKIESLDQLGPELVLEGATAFFDRNNFSARLFYAIPRRAKENTAYQNVYGGKEKACYSQEIYGADLNWQRYFQRPGSFLQLGLHFVGCWDNHHSIDPVALKYSPFAYHRTEILSFTARIPVFTYLAWRGEWIAHNHYRGRNLGQNRNQEEKNNGAGGMTGLVLDVNGDLVVKGDYLRLDEYFNSPFAALSYAAGGEGGRFSALWKLPGDRSALSLFYKKLHQIGPLAPDTQKTYSSMFGASWDFDLASGYGAGLGYLDEGNWRAGGRNRFSTTRKAFTASARYRFDNSSYLQAQYQRVKLSDDSTGPLRESFTDLYSLYLTVVF